MNWKNQFEDKLFLDSMKRNLLILPSFQNLLENLKQNTKIELTLDLSSGLRNERLTRAANLYGASLQKISSLDPENLLIGIQGFPDDDAQLNRKDAG